ncbi:MAG: DUF169 domain-containing protein [Syntrophomonadaceae bacterium]|nr:DUF169 domain-containing protein [Syntrophomonadaceae bacterium]
MKSKIATAIKLKTSPVAILFSDQRPDEAIQFKPGRWGCVIAMLAAAARGRTVVFDRHTYGCIGGGSGLGFGNTYVDFPGGIEYFLSTGNKTFCESEIGKKVIENMPRLVHGEKYKKTPEHARSFTDALPYYDVPAEFVVFKPIARLLPEDKAEVIVFLANPDQISGLTVLANYARHGGDNVFVPWGAGCHTIGIIPFNEGKSANPRAVIGLMDVSARKHIDKDILSFSVSYGMFMEMEDNVDESFLKTDQWEILMERN